VDTQSSLTPNKLWYNYILKDIACKGVSSYLIIEGFDYGSPVPNSFGYSWEGRVVNGAYIGPSPTFNETHLYTITIRASSILNAPVYDLKSYIDFVDNSSGLILEQAQLNFFFKSQAT
jgi:hypothetical protein